MKLNSLAIAGLMVFVVLGALYIMGEADPVTSFVLLITAFFLFLMSQSQKEKITMEEAVAIANENVSRLQRQGDIGRGRLRFNSEAEPSWDKNGQIFMYNVMFSVTTNTGRKYYMAMISVWGNWLGITKVRTDKTISEIRKPLERVPFDRNKPMDEEDDNQNIP